MRDTKSSRVRFQVMWLVGNTDAISVWSGKGCWESVRLLGGGGHWARFAGSVCMLSHFSHVQPFTTAWTARLPGSSVHGILQTRILEWVARPSSSGSSQPRDWTLLSFMSPTLAGRFFTTSATWEALCICMYALYMETSDFLQPPRNRLLSARRGHGPYWECLV